MTSGQAPEVAAALAAAVAAVNGVDRPGQQQMAQAVAEAMDSQGALLVQAGTGTGKSLAYLAPAAVHATAADTASPARPAVIVATATLALQRQLIERDLPRIAEAVAPVVGRPLTFAVLKGRHNYVCLDKLNREEPEDDSEAALFDSPRSALGRQAKALRTWADKTTTGDRDDYREPLAPQLWRSVSVQRRECVGAATCRFGQECFVEKARDLAREADIVVTNHAMLAIDVIEQIPVLPEHDVLVIDEAHELVDRITSTATLELSAAAVERAASRARRFLDDDLHQRLLDAAERLDDVLAHIAHTPGQTVTLDSVAGDLFLALTAVRDACHSAVTAMTVDREPSGPEEAAVRQRARGGLDEVHDAAGSLVTASQRDVVWVAAHERREPSVHIAPLSVAGVLRERLFNDRAVILTSATLTLGGSFEAASAAVGLAADDGHVELDVGSPFDHSRQGILYCPAHLPPPSMDGVSGAALAELADLMQAAGGRTLALFSSWRGVERAHEYLVGALHQRGLTEQLPLLVQQRGDAVGELVERFADQPELSLLGTLSLWQGVDVPGQTCSLVVIDRIPFPRPDEPVMAARAKAAEDSGRSGFAAVSLPRAALLLAQGTGRLIRSSDDRGVIAVLDSRLATKSYGRYLRASLPAYWWTTDAERARTSLQRLRAEGVTPSAAG